MVREGETPRLALGSARADCPISDSGASGWTEGPDERAAGRAAPREILPAYLMRRRWFAGKDEQDHRRSHRLRGAAQLLRRHPDHRGRDAAGGRDRALPRPARGRVGGPIAAAAGAAARPGAGSPGAPGRLPHRRLFDRGVRPRVVRGPQARRTMPTPDGEIRCLPPDGADALPRSLERREITLAFRRAVELVADRRQPRDGEADPPGRAGRPSRGRDDAASPRSATPTRRRCSARWSASAPDGTPHTLASSRATSPTRATPGPGCSTNLKRPSRTRRRCGERAARRGGPIFERPRHRFMATVGRRLGELHAALATPTDNSAFAPGGRDRRRCRGAGIGRAREVAGGASTPCSASTARLEPRVPALADEILARRDRLLEAAERLARRGRGRADDPHPRRLSPRPDPRLARRRLHHRLRGRAGCSTLEDRRAKASPLRDVAASSARSTMPPRRLLGHGTMPAPQPVRERRAALLDEFRGDARAFLGPTGRGRGRRGDAGIGAASTNPARSVHAGKGRL